MENGHTKVISLIKLFYPKHIPAYRLVFEINFKKFLIPISVPGRTNTLGGLSTARRKANIIQNKKETAPCNEIFLYWNTLSSVQILRDPLGGGVVTKMIPKYHKGGRHTWLWCDTSPHRVLCHCLMPNYERRCRISTLIMIPINFWRNSDPLKEKNKLSWECHTRGYKFS